VFSTLTASPTAQQWLIRQTYEVARATVFGLSLSCAEMI